MPVFPPQPQFRTCAQCERPIPTGQRWYRCVPEHLLDVARTRPVFGETHLCQTCLGYKPAGSDVWPGRQHC